jgi:hypothetical protein
LIGHIDLGARTGGRQTTGSEMIAEPSQPDEKALSKAEARD